MELNRKLVNKLLELNFLEKVSYLPMITDGMEVLKFRNKIHYINSTVKSDTFNVVFGAYLGQKEKKLDK